MEVQKLNKNSAVKINPPRELEELEEMLSRIEQNCNNDDDFVFNWNNTSFVNDLLKTIYPFKIRNFIDYPSNSPEEKIILDDAVKMFLREIPLNIPNPN
jgi:hypothetical protein